MEHCAAQEGFNVVDEINQRLLRLYPAAVDVELDDDPTVVDGLSSAHNSVTAWKNRLHNYQAEHDHLAQDEGALGPSRAVLALQACRVAHYTHQRGLYDAAARQARLHSPASPQRN